MTVKMLWIARLPTVTGQFGHEEVKTFPASVTVRQVLMHYVITLFPDAADVLGKRVLIKTMAVLEGLMSRALPSFMHLADICFLVCKI